MVKETVQSVKAENDKLKEKVDSVLENLRNLKESLKQQHPGQSNGDQAGATNSLDFLSKVSETSPRKDICHGEIFGCHITSC